MDYADQVYEYLTRLRPGTRINIKKASEPDRFIATVKDLMDNWGLKDFTFNSDYTILKRDNSINYEKRNFFRKLPAGINSREVVPNKRYFKSDRDIRVHGSSKNTDTGSGLHNSGGEAVCNIQNSEEPYSGNEN